MIAAIAAALRAWMSTALRILAAVALLLALFGDAIRPARTLPEFTLLLDFSASMPVEATEARWRELRGSLARAGAPAPLTIAFGGDVRIVPGGSASLAELRDAVDRSSTDVAAALTAALSRRTPGRPAAIAVVSDGHATAGDTVAALRTAHEARVPVYWLPVGRRATGPYVAAVRVPATARAGGIVVLRATVHAAGAGRIDIEAGLDDEDPARQSRTLHSGVNELSMDIAAGHSGLRTVAVRLIDPASGETLDERRPAAVVEVRGPPELLYVADVETPLLASLRAGGWPVEGIAPRRLPELGTSLDRYRAIILDDVPVEFPDAAVWRAIETAVRERGTGLAVLGGPRSFGRGGYRGSTLEGLLPVTSGPGDRAPPATVVFAIDKSGSMGSTTRGVDRLSHAREAVLATARTLAARDRVAIVAFDVAAQMLLPPTPVPQAIRMLEGAWQIAPSGGTRLAPALEAAQQLFADSPGQRRMLVLVTDGFLAGESLHEALTALRAARVDVVTLAVGSDARLEQAAALMRPLGGEVLRVAETAELPRLMPARVNARRASIVRGPVGVREVAALPFPSGMRPWPAVDAYASTHARSESPPALESASGDPILAARLVGLGRVLALPAGLGAWTPAWIDSRDWPRLAGALATWLSGTDIDTALGIAVRDEPGQLAIEVDSAHDARWQSDDAPSVTVIDPLGRRSEVTAAPGGPGRFLARVPATESGIYRIAARAGEVTRQGAHLRHAASETASRGVSAQLGIWQQQGLIRAWPEAGPEALARTRSTGEHGEPARALTHWLAAALAAFLAAVLIDCRGVLASTWSTARLRLDPLRERLRP